MSNNDFNKNNSFYYADTILRQCVECISNTINIDGVMGIDLVDVKEVLQNGGESLYLYGISEGKNISAV